MTIDYYALNQQTKKDVYPLPYRDDLLDELLCDQYLSIIDLVSGYHQIRLVPDDHEKTAFITQYGLFEHMCFRWVFVMHPAHFND